MKNLKKKKEKKMEEEGIIEHKSEKSDSDDNNITGKKDENAVYKDYFNILRTKPNITVVKFIQRQETEEEYNERIEREKEEIEKFKIEKKKNKNLEPRITEVNMEKLKINEASPSKINMKESYPIYCRWLASIFEIIKDRNITDVNTNCTLFQRIYPQENGVPIYNPKGIYWIKLYNLGKLRKIVIDDRMPCDKYDRFFLPKCDNLEEIWPAILTKALIKLYSYKIVSNNFKECGDYEIIYALTGFIPEMVDLIKEKNLYKMFDNYNNENVNNNENEDNKNEDKKDEGSIKQDIEKNNISKVNNSSFLSHGKSNNETELNIDNNINNEENSKFIFLEKALSDENYTENNCYMFCYKKTNEQPKLEYDKKMEIQPQKVYDSSQRRIRMNSLSSSPNKKGVVVIHGKKNRKVSIKVDNAEELKKEIEKEEKQLIAAGQRRSSLIRFKTLSSQNNKVLLELEKRKMELLNKKNDNLDDSNSNKLSNDNTINRSKGSKINPQSPIKERIVDIYMDKIYIGVIYDIIEFFSNYNYNMSRLVPIDFSDLRAMIKNFNTNNIFKQLSREEKRKYIQQLKEIKMKQKEEKTKRIESLKTKGKMYYSIKIQNSAVEEPVFIRSHTDEEIEMTKKILLNKWEFPPIEYLEHVYQQSHPNQENNESITQINQNKNENDESDKKKKKEYTWSKDVYMQLIENNTEQFKEQKEPLIRKEGTWIEPNDFFNCFDSFIILYNPKIYSNIFDWDNLWYDTKDVMSINTQNKVLHLVPNENTKKSYMVIVFCVNSDNKFIFRDAPFTIHFILLKKDDKIEDGRIITLDSFFGTKHIDQLNTNEEYFIVFTGGLFPTGFYLKFYSDFTIEPLLYNDYLSDYRGYTKQTYTIEHPNLNKNEFYVLLRVSVKLEVKTKFVVINNNTKDKALKDYTELYICENGNGNFKRNITFDNIFELQPKQYFFVITCIPPYNVEGDTFDIDILSYPEDNQILDVSQTNTAIPGDVNKAQAQLEQIEHINPYDITDKYIPNKHFILFKEYIFSGDIVYSSLNIKMRQFKKKEEEVEEDKKEEEQDTKAKKPQKDTNPSQPTSDMIEIPIDIPIRLKLELYDKEDNIIYETDFYNQITLHNIIFEGQTITEQKGKKDKGKDEETETNKPYRLICYLDESELPDIYRNLNPEEEYLDWIIRVFSSDTLGFCEDTHKEDKERAVIASWEEAEPGRAEKAKNSRRRYLLMKKKNNGDELDEEEEKFLSEIRIRKTEENKNEDNNQNNKNVKGKNDKVKNVKGKNEDEKEDEKKERTEINFNKKTSTVTQHSSLYIKNFLFYAYDKRCITYDHMFEQEQKVLNTEDVTNEKETNILRAYEENEKLYTESEEDKEKKKNEFIEENKKLYEEILTKRKDDEKKKEEVLKGRDDVKSILLVRAEAEVKLKELVELLEESESKNNEIDDKKKKDSNKFDFNSAFEIYNEIIKSELKHPLIEVAFNLLSKKKEVIIEEELKKAVKGKEKEIGLKLLEDIRLNHWNISEELLNKLDSIVE